MSDAKKHLCHDVQHTPPGEADNVGLIARWVILCHAARCSYKLICLFLASIDHVIVARDQWYRQFGLVLTHYHS